MTLFETILFIVFFFSLQPPASVEIYRVSCGNQLVRFPFRLSNQPDRCGYPRFNLSCKDQAQTVLSLPFSGEFNVVHIDYLFQNIWLNDPDHCTPKRLLHGLNLSSTPFDLLYPRSFTFFNSSAAASTQLHQAKYISCLSGTNFYVVALPAARLDSSASLSTSCLEIATVLVPCENGAGNCMFKSETGLDVGCSVGFTNGLSRHAKYGIMFGAGIPVLFIVGLVIYLRNKVEEDYNNRHPNQPELLSTTPRLDASVKGLDGQTIEAYPVTLLGESRRLPRPNDNTCPICLSEYQAKEMIRTIPDCEHYFHAVCIDEWLKLNAACPLCRNTPQTLAPIVSSSS
ncbi:hypothetical protein V6Z11_A08G121400 [Gossypium hirsutum]